MKEGPAVFRQEIIFSGRAGVRFFPGIMEKAGTFQAGQERIERTLDDNHIELLESVQNIGGVSLLFFGDNGKDTEFENAFAHLLGRIFQEFLDFHRQTL